MARAIHPHLYGLRRAAVRLGNVLARPPEAKTLGALGKRFAALCRRARARMAKVATAVHVFALLLGHGKAALAILECRASVLLTFDVRKVEYFASNGAHIVTALGSGRRRHLGARREAQYGNKEKNYIHHMYVTVSLRSASQQ